MPQFSKTRKAAAATRTEASPASPAYRLTERDSEREVLAFLAERPVHTVVMNGLVRDNGLDSPFNRGTFYACRGADGQLEGVALIGHAVFVEARSLAALKAFAEAAQEHRDAHMILGEQTMVSGFWDYYAPAGQPLRLFCRELLFEQQWPVAADAPVEGLRPATLEDLALVLPVHAAMAAAETATSLRAFASIAQGQQSAHMILGEREMVGRFWSHYAPAGQTPRLFCRELLFEQRWPVRAREPDEGLRPATLDDLMLVMPVHAAMAYEESGVNPIDVDLHGFRMRCARRIEHGRVWVLVEDGNLLFKADIASDTPESVYLEGVYVDPASRQRGYGLRCLSQLGCNLLERTKSVSALVNEQNLAAQALFQKGGYKLRGLYDTVFLEKN